MANKGKDEEEATQDRKKFKIFIEGYKEKWTININQNLTINNIKAHIN